MEGNKIEDIVAEIKDLKNKLFEQTKPIENKKILEAIKEHFY